MAECFRKHDPRPGRIAYEIAGLTWLDQAQGAPVVPVLSSGKDYLEEPYLPSIPPTPRAAEEFGRALAHTHAAGATHLGAPPPGIQHAWMGQAPLSMIHTPPTHPQSWGVYYSQYRLRPHAAYAPFSIEERHLLERVFTRLESGIYDHKQPALVEKSTHLAARTHGDLWSGNLMWTPNGVTLIDPAAQGGHAEEDLAALAVFGAPHIEHIWAAYNEISPLEDGWRERIALHQLHILMIHAQLFGHGYTNDVLRIAQRYG